MEMTRTRRFVGRFLLLAQVLLAVVIAVLVVTFAMRPGLKYLWDVTASARYTVDPSTKEVLAQIRTAHEKDEKRGLELHTIYATIPPRGNMRPEERAAWDIVESLQSLTTDLLRQYAYLGGPAVKVVHHDTLREIAQTREFAKSVGIRNENVVVVKFGARSKTLSIDQELADIDIPDPNQGGVPGSSRVPLLKSYKGEEAISSAIKSLLVEGKPKIYFTTGYQEPPIGAPAALNQRASIDGGAGAEVPPANAVVAQATTKLPSDRPTTAGSYWLERVLVLTRNSPPTAMPSAP